MEMQEEVSELYLNWKQEILKELRPFIVKNLQPEKLYTYLRSCEVFDEDDEEEIEAQITRRKKSESLIDFIGKRGDKGFDSFCEAIRQNTTQLFILRSILDSFQKKKQSYSADGTNGLLAEQIRQQDQRVQSMTLPAPGQPGGPAIPHFDPPEDNINVTGEYRQARSRSPPPPYSESMLF
eukprot:gene15629-17207_t